ncbi:penicillin-binding protein, 1A family [Desulfobulbus propionicus DSM 2032]|uniref:peptidoglycan glycosyltransferase n=1 Tax=Desulfobulbus propionicus (strain ATCC 33891 / DSM 2032 / VKM B-1956 / 1pr3) TaxID=577650 RepID=A0A7U4DNJ5_DESPD|nr:penicillin-binding protein, 1A family [Desulfobulbus propionicus DSM 2032]
MASPPLLACECQHYRFFVFLSTKASHQLPPLPEPPEPPYRGWVLDERHLSRLLLTIAATVTVLLGVVLAWFMSLPDIRTVDDYQPQVATLILDRANRPIDAIAREFRIVIPYERFPALLPQAFVAAEDSRFWRHEGLDGWSIARAAFNNLRSGRRSQGGSTITQQVTRALLLSREKSYTRKLAEAVLSFRLERLLSKEEILFIYLNEIYLGEGAYGVEAAALTYFGKEVGQLNLGEIALLAGLPQSPSNYSPLKQPEAARNRQRYVLNRMAEDGLITPEAAREAYDQGLQLAGNWRQALHGYFSAYVRGQLLTTYQEADLYRKGLQVATTVDARLQEAAAKAIQAGVTRVAIRHSDLAVPQGALVALDSASGRIRAMIGGVDFTATQFNRAVQANRQPGSAFKPIVYAAALEQGVSPAAVFNDAPLSLTSGNGRPWQPHNFNNEYRGPMPLAEALVRSSNVIAVRLAQQIGVERVVRTARRMGISAPLDANLALALGASPVSLLELTAAYTAFVNQGLYHPPVAITRVGNRQGRITPWPQPQGQQVIAPETAAWLKSVMTQVVLRGTGKNAAGIRGAGGKTGTTDNNVDAWFIGSAQELTTGVWIGHDRSMSLGVGETGGQAAAPAWKHFMLQAIN